MGAIRHLHAHYASLPAKVALLAHRLTGVSYSITTHAKDIFQNDPFASPKLRDRMGRASFVVANSQFSAEHIRAGLNNGARPSSGPATSRNFVGLGLSLPSSPCSVAAPGDGRAPRGSICVVYNGLDLDAFPLRPTSPGQPLLLAVGRLVEKKGFSILIAACRLLKQKGIRFTCEIVGTGVCSHQLKEELRDRGLGHLVKLVGPLPQQMLREHYARAMVFVLPCIRAADGDRDILPNALKEAMAVGVPVVTSRLEGIEELIEDGVSGLLVEPGDPCALAAKLELVLSDPRLRQDLAVQGRKAIEERFDRRTNFAGLKTLLMTATQMDGTPSLQTNEAVAESDYANCVH